MEKYYRTPVEINDETSEIETVIDFQAFEWSDANDGEYVDTGDAGDDYDEEELQEYVIKVFGVTNSGQSICLRIEGFRPFFYIRIPSTWTQFHMKDFFKKFKNAQPKKFRPAMKGCSLVKAKDFVGYHGEDKFSFLKISFLNSEACKKARYAVNNYNGQSNYQKSMFGFKSADLKCLKTYEATLDHFLRFAHSKSIRPSGWITVKDFEQTQKSLKARTQINITTNYDNVEAKEGNNNAPILQASYDIEAYSHDGSFPNPEVLENVVTMVATSFKVFGQKDFLFKHVVTLKTCAPIDTPGVFVECYDTEKEVLLAWSRLITNMDPDVLYAYNSDYFDGHYLMTRSKICNIEKKFGECSRLQDQPCHILIDQFSSSAYGKSTYRRFKLPGRISFDILIYIQREFKEPSYKLDDVSEKYLGQKKHDVSPQQIFGYFADGSPELIKTVALYCTQDAVLPQLLVDKFHILQNQISMSNVTTVPISFLIYKGQQIKVYSQILGLTAKLGYLVPDSQSKFKPLVPKNSDESDEEEEKSFKGASVLQPQQGIFWDPITTLDFASLYPSIMIANNLCYSTHVQDEKYYNLPGVDYITAEWEDVNDETGKVTSHKYHYVQNEQGILPKLLLELANSRKDAKKKMALTTDPFEKAIYDKLQLAYKVSMNSAYGFLSAQMIHCKPIAATVTYFGRKMIEQTKDSVERQYDASVVIYGDSVTADSPLMLSTNNMGENVTFKEIGNLVEKNKWLPYENFKPFDPVGSRTDKQQSTTGLYVHCDMGWTKIKRVIRHKTKKRIFRITTRTGTVDVTEDHSLVDENGKYLKPKDCKVGTKLMTAFPIKK